MCVLCLVLHLHFGVPPCHRLGGSALCRVTQRSAMPPPTLLEAMQAASADIKIVHSALASANRAGGSAEAVRARAAGLDVSKSLGLSYDRVVAVVNHLKWAGQPPSRSAPIRGKFRHDAEACIWFQAAMQVLGATGQREFVCGPLPKAPGRRRIRRRSRRAPALVEVVQPPEETPPGGRLPIDSETLLEEISPLVRAPRWPAAISALNVGLWVPLGSMMISQNRQAAGLTSPARAGSAPGSAVAGEHPIVTDVV